MSRLVSAAAFWRILREVNLDEIRDEAERPFHLLVTGDDNREAESLARLLSDPDQAAFVHPWITRLAPDQVLGDHERVDLALAVITQEPPSESMRAALSRLHKARVPTLVVVTGPAAQQPHAALARREETRRVAVPALDRETVQGPVAQALLEVAPPALHLSLARHLPGLRPAAFQRLIQETAQANAGYAFTTGLAEVVPVLNVPLNVGDTIVLTKNQLIMAYKLALIAGKQGAPRELIGEIIGVLGGGLLFRQIARQLVGLIPVWGVLPKTAVAYAGTWAIGQAIIHWATEGTPIPQEQLAQVYQEALERGRTVAQALAERVRGRVQS